MSIPATILALCGLSVFGSVVGVVLVLLVASKQEVRK